MGSDHDCSRMTGKPDIIGIVEQLATSRHYRVMARIEKPNATLRVAPSKSKGVTVIGGALRGTPSNLRSKLLPTGATLENEYRRVSS